MRIISIHLSQQQRRSQQPFLRDYHSSTNTTFFAATISESQSPRSSQSLTPTNAHNSASSTRERSTFPSISEQSKPAPFEDVYRSTRARRHWRRQRNGRFISLNENTLSRYASHDGIMKLRLMLTVRRRRHE